MIYYVADFHCNGDVVLTTDRVWKNAYYLDDKMGTHDTGLIQISRLSRMNQNDTHFKDSVQRVNRNPELIKRTLDDIDVQTVIGYINDGGKLN